MPLQSGTSSLTDIDLSLMLQIHSAYTIIVRRITACLTRERMYGLVSVGSLGMSADRTALGRIPRVHLYRLRALQRCLVLDETLQIVKRPTHRH